MQYISIGHIQVIEEPNGFIIEAGSTLQYLCATLLGETAGQRHVLHNGQVRNQIEQLKDATDVISQETISLGSIQSLQILTKNLDLTIEKGRHGGQ